MFENMVQTMKGEEKKGSLVEPVVILATDNAVMESASYKDNSSSNNFMSW